MTSEAQPASEAQPEWKALEIASRQRNKRRLRLALLIAAVIAVLLFKTQWPALQPGLFILLAGQLALAGFLFLRNRSLNNQDHPLQDQWFQEERTATRQAAWLENGPRILGFAALAYGFWRSTGNLPVTLALGVTYPALLCWSLARALARTKLAPNAPQWKV